MRLNDGHNMEIIIKLYLGISPLNNKPALDLLTHILADATRINE